jgi:hypothetical protein
VVYAAAAELRRDVNGVPAGEPAVPRPGVQNAPCADATIVRAAIHPAIGIARIGDSRTDYFIGPEVTTPASQPPGTYRDTAGDLKRQAALFHVYGYNAAGQVVRELTADSADIQWTAHLANKKAQWYQFQAALDIPEAVTMSVPQRNPKIAAPMRGTLAIDPGPRSITGISVSGGPEHCFDTGTFKGTPVPLGEIRTDAAGRLLVLGGTGQSASPSGAPVYDPADPNSFNNADDWYDDISDGPVTATVSINGQAVPVDPAWVVVTPPNYAPDIIGWRTLYDLLVDVYIECGWMAMPDTVSFSNDILPVLQRLSNLQWVNQGFATMFGKGCPMDFTDPALVAKLARTPDPADKSDPYAELRQVIFNSFRPYQPTSDDPRPWPWIYGDAYGSFSAAAPNNNLALPSVQQVLLRRWVAGDFVNDWNPATMPPATLAAVPLAGQPAMLDKAALHFCLADAFHPGCEMTWPMRQPVCEPVPYPSSPVRPAGAGLRRQPDAADRLAPRRAAVCPGSGRYQPLDGAAVAGRHRILPVRIRCGLRSLFADLLGGARAQPGADRGRLPDRDGHRDAARTACYRL